MLHREAFSARGGNSGDHRGERLRGGQRVAGSDLHQEWIVMLLARKTRLCEPLWCWKIMASTLAELGLRCYPWKIQMQVSRMTAQCSHLDRAGVVICR